MHTVEHQVCCPPCEFSTGWRPASIAEEIADAHVLMIHADDAAPLRRQVRTWDHGRGDWVPTTDTTPAPPEPT